MRGADLHVHSYYYMYLLRARIRLKLAQADGMKKAGVGFDVRRQQREEIRRRYSGEAKNRFEVLGDIEDPEEEHNRILETYRGVAKNVIRWLKNRASHGLEKKHREKFRRGKRQTLKWKVQDQNS